MISIHAPSRGATLIGRLTKDIELFQSTHPQGVRLVMTLITLYMANFNPRTLKGCDKPRRADTPPSSISIHAPSRGATYAQANDDRKQDISIHAPSRGATYVRLLRGKRPQFQSTHPQGVRLKRKSLVTCLKLFQSTHPQGVRLNILVLACMLFQFQSTHPQGVRLTLDTHSRRFGHFNPRTLKGCDSKSWQK